jgi:pimeloyl-ACP methyl ester carboxylesterase
MTAGPEYEREIIEVDGGLLVAELAGAGSDPSAGAPGHPLGPAGRGQALLFVHSGITDRRMWDAQFAAFAGHYRVVRYDLRGYGESSPISAPYSHVADLQRLIDRLGLQRPRVIAASLGARVAVDLALSVPDQFERMVLVGPALSGLRFEDPRVRTCWNLMEAAWDAGDVERVIELEIGLWIDGPSRAPGSVDAAVRERVREMQRRIYQMAPEDDPERDIDPPAAARLDRLALPLLVVVGEHDVQDIHRNCRLLAQQAPDARLTVMPGTAHLPSMEAPDEFNELALAFLR